MSRGGRLAALVVLASCGDAPTGDDEPPSAAVPETPPSLEIVVHELGTLGGENSWANDIDSKGRIVGSAETADGEVHAFLWEDGVMIDISDGLGEHADGSSATKINERGDIFIETCDPGCHMFLRRDGVVHYVGYGLGVMNEPGQVLLVQPAEEIGPSATRLTLWENGSTQTIVEFNTWGNSYFNDRGELLVMTHVCPSGDSCEGFFWSAGEIVEFVVPDDEGLSFGGLNNAGQIVATHHYGPFDWAVMLWEAGTWTPLDGLPCDARYPHFIDDQSRVLVDGLARYYFQEAEEAVDSRGFVWEAGEVLVLEHGEPEWTADPQRSNAAGDIIGSQCFIDCAVTTGAFWRGGELTALPGDAIDINDSAQIAGVMHDWLDDGGGMAVRWDIPPVYREWSGAHDVHDQSRCDLIDEAGM